MPVNPEVAATGMKRIESSGFGSHGWGWGFVNVYKNQGVVRVIPIREFINQVFWC